jgi:hypothetical protein
MITHTSVPLRDWPVVKAELLAASFTDQVKIHYLTHSPDLVCMETRTPADLAIVTDAAHNAVARHRNALKKQLLSRRTELCRTKLS